MPELKRPTTPRKQSFGRPDGTSTSISLEDAFWEALKKIASEKTYLADETSPGELIRTGFEAILHRQYVFSS